MSHIGRYGKAFVCIFSLGLGTASIAQSNDAKPSSVGNSPDAGVKDLQFFIGQRVWLATWDQAYLDALVVIQNPLNPVPMIQETSSRAVSDTAFFPQTSFGVRFKNWTLSTTLVPQTKFTSGGLAVDDTIRRDEVDLSVGYAFSPNIVGSIVYRTARIDQVATANATRLTGVGGSYKVEGLLVGVSGSAQLQGPLALYGNIGYGPARQTIFASGTSELRFNGDYQISEVGFAYRLADNPALLGFTSLSMQLGYRSQTVTLNDIGFGTYSTGSVPALIATQSKSVRSTTQGIVFGIVGAF